MIEPDFDQTDPTVFVGVELRAILCIGWYGFQTDFSLSIGSLKKKTNCKRSSLNPRTSAFRLRRFNVHRNLIPNTAALLLEFLLFSCDFVHHM